MEMMRGGEIFVPKIPSTTIVDSPRFGPNLAQHNVGVRPGEKPHETMIPADDCAGRWNRGSLRHPRKLRSGGARSRSVRGGAGRGRIQYSSDSTPSGSTRAVCSRCSPTPSSERATFDARHPSPLAPLVPKRGRGVRITVFPPHGRQCIEDDDMRRRVGALRGDLLTPDRWSDAEQARALTGAREAVVRSSGTKRALHGGTRVIWARPHHHRAGDHLCRHPPARRSLGGNRLADKPIRNRTDAGLRCGSASRAPQGPRRCVLPGITPAKAAHRSHIPARPLHADHRGCGACWARPDGDGAISGRRQCPQRSTIFSFHRQIVAMGEGGRSPRTTRTDRSSQTGPQSLHHTRSRANSCARRGLRRPARPTWYYELSHSG